MIKKLIFTILILGVAGVSIVVYLFRKPHQSILNATPKFSLSAANFAGEYEKSEKEANAKYLNNVIEVEGVVVEKTLDEKGLLNLTLQGIDLSGVSCVFDKKNKANVMKYKEGDKIKVKGICTGVLMDVVLVDCVLSQEKN